MSIKNPEVTDENLAPYESTIKADPRGFQPEQRTMLGERERCALKAEQTAQAALKCMETCSPESRLYHQIYHDIAMGIAADIRSGE